MEPRPAAAGRLQRDRDPALLYPLIAIVVVWAVVAVLLVRRYTGD